MANNTLAASSNNMAASNSSMAVSSKNTAASNNNMVASSKTMTASSNTAVSKVRIRWLGTIVFIRTNGIVSPIGGGQYGGQQQQQHIERPRPNADEAAEYASRHAGGEGQAVRHTSSHTLQLILTAPFPYIRQGHFPFRPL